MKFYAKWKEFTKEQAIDPDQPRYLTRFVYPILVPAGPGWDNHSKTIEGYDQVETEDGPHGLVRHSD